MSTKSKSFVYSGGDCSENSTFVGSLYECASVSVGSVYFVKVIMNTVSTLLMYFGKD